MKTIKASSSKSLFNRALIVSSFSPEIKITGDIQSYDIEDLKQTLDDFKQDLSSLNLTDGGTTFRFLVIRLLQSSGKWELKVKPRILERPIQGLENLVHLLGGKITINKEKCLVTIESKGWSWSDEIKIETTKTSQYLTALLLSAWNLPKDLFFVTSSQTFVSQAYFKMTLQLLESFGMQVDYNFLTGRGVVFSGQSPLIKKLVIDSDMSSVFTLACWGALNNGVRIEWIRESLDIIQPDSYFLTLFKELKIVYRETKKYLLVEKINFNELTYQELNINLESTPDLFPCLVILLAHLKGKFYLSGLSHLSYKESNRFEKVIELLRLIGKEVHIINNNQICLVASPEKLTSMTINFDVEDDHRLVFAATLLKTIGYQIRVNKVTPIKKSYSHFLKDLDINEKDLLWLST